MDELSLLHPAHAQIESLYREGRNLFDNKEYEKSIEKFEQVVAAVRSFPDYEDTKGYEEAALFWIELARVEAETRGRFGKRPMREIRPQE